MALIEGANAIANEELLDLNPELIEPFTQILQFYAYSPDSLPEKRGKQPTGGVEHVISLVKTYCKARSPKSSWQKQKYLNLKIQCPRSLF